MGEHLYTNEPMSEAEVRINLKALKKLDPCIMSIVAHSSHVSFYQYVRQEQGEEDWEQTKIEGTLFVYRREAAPKHGFIIMNRNSMENLMEVVTEELTFQCDPPFLLYKNSRGRKEGNRHGIFGIWFYNQGECEFVSKTIVDLQQELKRTRRKDESALFKDQTSSEDLRGPEGAGKLGQLFKSAVQEKEGGQPPLQTSKQDQRARPPAEAPGSKSDRSGANLLRLLNPAQMAEAMRFLLDTDHQFVLRLHEAYMMAVQRRGHNGHH